MTAITLHRAPFRCLRRFVPPHGIRIRLQRNDSRGVLSAAKKIAAMNQISRLSDIFTTIISARVFRYSAKYAISSPVGSDKRQMAEFVEPSAYRHTYLSRMLIDPEQIRQKKISWIEQPGEA
jgi:hypothetical protein